MVDVPYTLVTGNTFVEPWDAPDLQVVLMAPCPGPGQFPSQHLKKVVKKTVGRESSHFSPKKNTIASLMIHKLSRNPI